MDEPKISIKKIDKNTIEITNTTPKVEVSTYIIDDLYDQVKKSEEQIQEFVALKNTEIENLKKIISEAESLEVEPVNPDKKTAVLNISDE